MGVTTKPENCPLLNEECQIFNQGNCTGINNCPEESSQSNDDDDGKEPEGPGT